jgi:hypothetical protein
LAIKQVGYFLQWLTDFPLHKNLRDWSAADDKQKRAWMKEYGDATSTPLELPPAAAAAAPAELPPLKVESGKYYYDSPDRSELIRQKLICAECCVAYPAMVQRGDSALCQRHATMWDALGI